MRWSWLLMIVLLFMGDTTSSSAAVAEMPAEAKSALESFHAVVEKARAGLIESLDEQISQAAKRGDLAEVKGFQAEKDALQKRGVLPTSSRLKTAVTKFKSSIRANYDKTRLALESCVKQHTKTLAIETAEHVQKELDVLVKQWQGVVSVNGTASTIPVVTTPVVATLPKAKGTDTKGAVTTGQKPVATSGSAGGNGVGGSGVKATLFKVNSASWGHNEIFKPGLERANVTDDFAARLRSGEEVVLNEATFGPVMPSNTMKAMNVEVQAGDQRLLLWMNGGTRLKLSKAATSNEPAWSGGPIQILSATWSLADGTQPNECLARMKEHLRTKGRTVTGYHEYGELQFGKSKIMTLKLQAEDALLELQLAEPSRIEFLPPR